jgi:hypothetical protein
MLENDGVTIIPQGTNITPTEDEFEKEFFANLKITQNTLRKNESSYQDEDIYGRPVTYLSKGIFGLITGTTIVSKEASTSAIYAPNTYQATAEDVHNYIMESEDFYIKDKLIEKCRKNPNYKPTEEDVLNVDVNENENGFMISFTYEVNRWDSKTVRSKRY